MIVYHGGTEEIIKIDLSKAKSNKDFGKGFYVTNIKEQADKWAEVMADRRKSSGVVTCFKFDESVLDSDEYKVKVFDSNGEEWARFVATNRRNDTNTPIHDYDIVIGPVADDFRYRDFSKYLKNEMPEEEFFEGLKFVDADDSHQICFCTEKSLDTITRINLKAFHKIESIGVVITDSLVKNHGFSEAEAQDFYYNSEICEKVSDETTELYNKPWQEIYDMLKKEIETK